MILNNISSKINSKYYQIISQHPWTAVVAPQGAPSPTLKTPALNYFLWITPPMPTWILGYPKSIIWGEHLSKAGSLGLHRKTHIGYFYTPKPRPRIIECFNQWKIADIQAHSAAPSPALRACRSAIFEKISWKCEQIFEYVFSKRTFVTQILLLGGSLELSILRWGSVAKYI